MGSLSIWHWLIVLAVVLILFGGGGKLSRLMGDMAKGVTAFRKGLKDGEPGDKPPETVIDQKSIPSEAVKPGPAEGIRRDETAKG